ncbi:MAG TPA: asparagine synthase (glutamine-hydrolyzing), partial [Gemmatimonadales bacterium]
MCGIVGIVYRDPGRRVAPETLAAMRDAIRHRGPDDEGALLDGSAGLGMRRLSIIDVAGGMQPIASGSGRLTLVCNGEIYNYRELRASLVGRGHRFRTHSDVETILHLYEDVGPAAAERLRGMFAAAVWDGAARTLWLARDRFGIKPLYYVARPWGVAFASELKALLAADLTTRVLDWEALDEFCQLGYVAAPATPFQDVRKLEPGHWLLWRETGELIVQRYWSLPAGGGAWVPDDLPRRVAHWLDESVAAHMVSDVPVAAFLSGGIDSSSVVASMVHVAAASPQVFTARYFGSGAASSNEAAAARQLADRYGVRLSLVDIRPELRDVLEPIAWALDEPIADDSAIPTWLLCAAVGGSHKVALTGLGGDELFAGYRRHIGLLAAERYGRLPSGVRRAAAGLGGAVPDWGGNGLAIDRMKRFLRAGATSDTAPGRYLGLVSRLADDERRAL